MTEVEVALVGRRLEHLTMLEELSSEWFEGFYDGEETREWAARPRVKLEVADDETLREVLVRAVEALGIWELDWDDPSFGGRGWSPGTEGQGTRRFIALRYDASPIPVVERLSVGLTTVDRVGRALWGRPYQPVTYRELRRAAEAGATPGDPTMLYLSVRPDAAGGAIGHEWSLLVQVWDVAWRVAAGLVVVNELHDFYSKLKKGLAGREVVGRNAEEWVRRNGHADSLAYMLRGDPWLPFDLAALLGCTKEEAKEVLALYGYAQGDDGDIWVYVAGNETLGLPVMDSAAHALVRFIAEVQRRYLDGTSAPEGEVAALFREVVRQAERGHVGELAHLEYRDPLQGEPPSRLARARDKLRRSFKW